MILTLQNAVDAKTKVSLDAQNVKMAVILNLNVLMRNIRRKEKKKQGGIKRMENNRLDALIPQYAANKAELDDYKKICDKENAIIKSIMADMDEPTYEAGGYKATYSVSERTSMNEEMLLEIAHNYGIPNIIKTKEYIDFDALENAIYKGDIPKEALLEMDKAKEVKEVVTLRVTKIKKKKEEE